MAIKGLHTADMQPSSEELEAMSFVGGMVTYENVKLDTINESANEMEVEIVDCVMTFSMMGQSESITMSEMKSEMCISGNTVVKLKEEGGKWLINEPYVISPLTGLIPDMPDISVPSGST